MKKIGVDTNDIHTLSQNCGMTPRPPHSTFSLFAVGFAVGLLRLQAAPIAYLLSFRHLARQMKTNEIA